MGDTYLMQMDRKNTIRTWNNLFCKKSSNMHKTDQIISTKTSQHLIMGQDSFKQKTNLKIITTKIKRTIIDNQDKTTIKTVMLRVRDQEDKTLRNNINKKRMSMKIITLQQIFSKKNKNH